MSKSKIVSELAKLSPNVVVSVPWWAIHAFDERNTRFDSWGNPLSDLPEQIRQLKPEGGENGGPEKDSDRKATPDGLVGRMFDGWDTMQQGYIEGTAPTADEVTLCYEQRRKRIDNWRSMDDVTYHRLAAFAESAWFPNGKPCGVQVIANMAYRRTRALPAVAYARNVRQVRAELVIPVMVREYASKLDGFFRHLDENNKDAGRKQYSPLDVLLIAQQLLGMGGNEGDLRKRLKNVGEAQRACRFVKLSDKFPELNLIQRVMLAQPSVDPGEKLPYSPAKAESEHGPAELGCYFPYTSVNKEHLQALLTDKDVWSAATMKDRPDVVTTKRVVEAYIEKLLQGGNTPPTWSKADSATLEKNADSAFARLLGWLIAKGKRPTLDKLFAQHGKAIDAAFGKGFDFDTVKTGEATAE